MTTEDRDWRALTPQGLRDEQAAAAEASSAPSTGAKSKRDVLRRASLTAKGLRRLLAGDPAAGGPLRHRKRPRWHVEA
jgi:hypothetical protein